jgi:hypothetical protein
MGVYLRHMKPDGIIAFHVTNRFLDLVPVVEALGRERGLAMLHIADDTTGFASRSDWMLLATRPAVLARAGLADVATPLAPRRDWRIWTDDFNNLLQVLK